MTKKNETMPFAATWMGLDIVTLSEVSQTEREKCDIPDMRNLKRNGRQIDVFTKQTHRRRE